MPVVSTDCDQDQAARKLYDDVNRQVVRIELGDTPYPRTPESAKVGTGFFVNDGDEIVTNVHVALAGSYADVLTSDGKTYHARLEKLDTEDDLALFKVEGITADPTRALKPDVTPLKPDEELIGFGHPNGSEELWASPGLYKKTDGFLNSLGSEEKSADVVHLKDRAKSTDPVESAEAKAYLDAPRLQMILRIQHGNSGGPAVDAAGHLRAVAADRLSARHSLYIPADKVEKLLTQPETRFKFNYQKDGQGNEHLVSIDRLNGGNSTPIVLEVPKKP